MKKFIVIQICLLILFTGALGGLLVNTDIYDEVESGITSVLCLSCIKLNPKTQLDFTYDTATGDDHSDFVLDALYNGPIFIAYREDVCIACDKMEPILQDIFSVHFEKEDTITEEVSFDDATVTFVHINIDHANEQQIKSRFIYDKDDIGGVPMFTVVTLGYNSGFVEPYYATVYGTLSLDTNEERKGFLTNMINDGIEFYNQNKEGYNRE